MESLYLGLALQINMEWKSPELLRDSVGVLKRLKELGDRAPLVIMNGTGLTWQFSEAIISWGNPAVKKRKNSLGHTTYLGLHMCGNNWARTS